MGGGWQRGLAVELDLRLVAGGVEDLVADAEHSGASAAAARLVAEVDPADTVGERDEGERAQSSAPPPLGEET